MDQRIGRRCHGQFPNRFGCSKAAVKIQEACNTAKEFQLRIGIHHGEVVFENEDIFGDAVNIAARIQAAAKPGTIYISESVHRNASNKKDIQSRIVKEEILKNVSQPVRMYQVLFAGSEIIAEEMPVHLSELSLQIIKAINEPVYQLAGGMPYQNLLIRFRNKNLLDLLLTKLIDEGYVNNNHGV